MKNFTLCLLLTCLGGFTFCDAQEFTDSIRMFQDVKITLDVPSYRYRQTTLILYALPNGNTTAQTMGKKLTPGDDWHFDIQHIKAQTSFLREKLKQNIVVAYLENNYKSWPLWKQKHPDFNSEIPHIVDTLYSIIPSRIKSIHLSGHSGGGSFVFGYLAGVETIPASVQRITFLDSDYGYDSSYYIKLKTWLQQNKKATLTVFAYNDSVALLNGKPFVSATGGTWYRSHLMLQHLQKDFSFKQTKNDSLIFYRSTNNQIALFFKNNPDRKIFHTRQVELNGFIHSVLYRTKEEDKGYEYFGARAYSKFIE